MQLFRQAAHCVALLNHPLQLYVKLSYVWLPVILEGFAMRAVVSPVLAALIGVFALEPATAQAAQGSAGADAARRPRQADPERRICRSTPETGSLARRRRQCFTAAEWNRIADAARENATYEMDRQRTRSSGE